MYTRIICLVFGAMLFALILPVGAQQPTKVVKIGTLGTGSGSSSSPGREILRRELHTLGYVEGKNIAFEYRYADGELEHLPALAHELVGLKVDALVTPGTPAALAAKNATRTIPIVFTGVADPIRSGLVDSLAQPGGNVTGFTEISEVLAGERLELLKEIVPKLSRVAVLWNPRNPGNTQQWKESQLAARELRLELHSMAVSSVDKFDNAFREATKARSGALAVAQDSLAQSNLKLIADLAIKNRLPAIYPRGEFVIGGGLMSYGADPAETYKRVASMIDKILKGTKPADLPVEQPTKFEFVINLKTANQIGLTIPQWTLMKADRVVK